MSTPSWLKEKDPGQKNIFDLDSGRRERDDALELVSRKEFMEGVERVVDSLVGKRMTGEDIREVCTTRDVVPHHPNAWGAAINSMVIKGKMVRTKEFRQMKATKSHARRTPVYLVTREVAPKESLSDKLMDIGVEDALLMDGYDDCVVGVLERFGMEPIILYDKEKVIEKIMKESPGGSYQEALEYYEFNQLGGWHGDKTPGFLVRLFE